MKFLSQVGLDYRWVQRAEARKLRECIIEMDKTLNDDVSLNDAIGAALRLTVNECEVGPRKIVAKIPVFWVLRWDAEEEVDIEALSDLELLELDTSGPIIELARARYWGTMRRPMDRWCRSRRVLGRDRRRQAAKDGVTI